MKPVKLKNGKCFLTFQEISARVKAEEELQKRKEELELKTKELEEVNTALRVLLKRRENDKIEIEEKVLYNVKDLVMPYLEKLTDYVNRIKTAGGRPVLINVLIGRSDFRDGSISM